MDKHEKKSWEYKLHTISFLSSWNESIDGRHIGFKVSINSKEDTFDFIISVSEAVKNSDQTDIEYIEKAVENIKYYINAYDIKGDLVHIFDFIDSDFIPRENINWP